MKKLLFFLLVMLISFGHLAKAQENHKIDGANPLRQDILIDTSFTDFFDQFMWVEAFQKSRIKFPINNEEKKLASPNDWKHLPYYTKSEYMSVLSARTLSLHERDIESEQLDLFFVDLIKKTSLKHQFKKIDQKWFLTKMAKTTMSAVPDHDFVNFLLKFSADVTFQMQHIRFPLSKSYLNTNGDYETIAVKIRKEDWEHLKLTEQINPLLVLSEMDSNNQFRNILCRGVDNGIWIKYTFENIDGNWTMIQFEDHST